jgi:hypothetical protein
VRTHLCSAYDPSACPESGRQWHVSLGLKEGTWSPARAPPDVDLGVWNDRVFRELERGVGVSIEGAGGTRSGAAPSAARRRPRGAARLSCAGAGPGVAGAGASRQRTVGGGLRSGAALVDVRLDLVPLPCWTLESCRDGGEVRAMTYHTGMTHSM